MKFHVDHTSPPRSPGRRTIFVFGSNTAGRHGMGAALYAAKHMGAERYVGHGRTGDAIAIPTEGGGRTGPLWTLPLAEIAPLVKSFVSYAATHPELDFLVTRIGCGLAGYADTQIAPMFSGATPNCSFVVDWRAFLQESSEGGQPADWVEAGLRLTERSLKALRGAEDRAIATSGRPSPCTYPLHLPGRSRSFGQE